jgi:hypothetical protein
MSKEKSEKAPKAPKQKKRPSDFEIVRTILTRTHERKLPYLLKNMGEDSDILFFCSEDESGFTYGSSEMSIGLLEITDPELRTMVDNTLSKMYGYKDIEDKQLVINVRDQMSALVKTKGESIDEEVSTNEYGASWVMRKDIKGQERTLYYSKTIESLYHFQVVREWNNTYRPLLSTEDDDIIYLDYRYDNKETSSIVKFDIPKRNQTNTLEEKYPNGFRTTITKGIDAIMVKNMENFPYPILKAEMIFFGSSGWACHIAHRVTAQGWRMLVLRPNMVFIPPLSVLPPNLESFEL